MNTTVPIRYLHMLESNYDARQVEIAQQRLYTDKSPEALAEFEAAKLARYKGRHRRARKIDAALADTEKA